MMTKSHRNCHLLIAVAGAAAVACQNGSLSFGKVTTCVLDEADFLLCDLHMQSVEVVLKKLKILHPRPQFVLVGATLPSVMLEAAKSRIVSKHHYVVAPLKPVSGGQPQRAIDATSDTLGHLSFNPAVTHTILMVGANNRTDQIRWLFGESFIDKSQPTLIFCNAKATVTWLHEQLILMLNEFQCNVAYVHAGVDQADRIKVLRSFHGGGVSVLVTTGLMARGMNFPKAVHVINFDMPPEFEDYVHRVGRVGRGGHEGFAFSFFTPQDRRLARPLAAYLNRNNQRVPPKLQEYANESMGDFLRKSMKYTGHGGGKHYDSQLTEYHKPVLGKGSSRKHVSNALKARYDRPQV
jgi:superfamily II DNA/RNA helicase